MIWFHLHDVFRCGTAIESRGIVIAILKKEKQRGLETREKVSSRRISLESNTYVHGSNTRNLPI
jgi:hypothetical protein